MNYAMDTAKLLIKAGDNRDDYITNKTLGLLSKNSEDHGLSRDLLKQHQYYDQFVQLG